MQSEYCIRETSLSALRGGHRVMLVDSDALSFRRSGSAAQLVAQDRSSSSVATELGVARQTAVRWYARWRTGSGAALRSRGASRRPAVPDSQPPAIDQALLQGRPRTGSTATHGPSPASGSSSNG
jgi:hypothetical protein